jgi:hypothetical protein
LEQNIENHETFVMYLMFTQANFQRRYQEFMIWGVSEDRRLVVLFTATHDAAFGQNIVAEGFHEAQEKF